MDPIIITINGIIYDATPRAAALGVTADPSNPFVGWKSLGYDLVQIQVWILHRAFTAEELVQAEAAGYDVVKPAPPGPVVAPDFASQQAVPFTFAALDSPPQTISFTPEPAKYQIIASDGDAQHGESQWTVSQGGQEVATGTGTAGQDTHFDLPLSPCTFTVALRPDQITRTGTPISTSTYQLRKIG